MNEQDILKMIQRMSEERIENADNLTVGALLEQLESFEENKKLRLSTGEFFNLNGEFDSYRGYYEDLAIEKEVVSDDSASSTVFDFKKILNNALKQGEMCGYKGGDYSINESTLVWFGSYGTTGGSLKIVGVYEIQDLEAPGLSDCVYVDVQEDEY